MAYARTTWVDYPATTTEITAARLNNIETGILAVEAASGTGVYTTEAARDAAITSPTEGQRAYITASTETTAVGATTTAIPTGIQTIYNGSVWVTVTEVGAFSYASSQALTTSYADLTVGGIKTQAILRTGTTALVSVAGRSLATANYYFLNVATATASAPTFGEVANNGAVVTSGKTFVFTGLTAGLNTFTVQGKLNAGAGTWDYLSLVVKGIA